MNLTIEDVFRECAEYIEIIKNLDRGSFLIRGVSDQNVDIKKKVLYIDNRVPKNVPQEIHDELNRIYREKFGWPVRNGLFCYGVSANYDDIRDLGYGKNHFLFPCGQFRYAYDPEVFDLLQYHFMFCKTEGIRPNEEFIAKINYVEDNLAKAMTQLVFENERSVEIILNCEYYYLINSSYATDLSKRIWG